MKKILALSLVLVISLGWLRPSIVKKSCVSLGTIVEITVADKDKPRKTIDNAIEKAFREIKRTEDTFSRFKSHSEISRINSFAQQEPTRVTPETIELIEKSIEFSQLTDGAFDITVRPLIEAWGIEDRNRKYVPEAIQLKRALEKVGYQNIRIIKEKQSVFLTRPGMSLDLGGIAKGYAVDKAIQSLREEGIKNALVNAGGDIYALGERSMRQKWQIALQHPRKRNASLTVIELKDAACATSGDYQRYIKVADSRFSHIVNPKTGQPCSDLPASVTVLSKDCLTADALATAIFVLGPEKGIDLINRLEGIEAVIVSVHNDKLEILLSQGLKERLQFSSSRINP